MPPKLGDSWKLNLFRLDAPEGKPQMAAAWSPPLVGDFHALDKFGEIVFADEKGQVPATPAAAPTKASREPARHARGHLRGDDRRGRGRARRRRRQEEGGPQAPGGAAETKSSAGPVANVLGRQGAVAVLVALPAALACARLTDLGAAAAPSAAAPPRSIRPRRSLARPAARPPSSRRRGRAARSTQRPPLRPLGRGARGKLSGYQLALIERIREAARAAGAPIPMPDERLCDLAADLARLAPPRRQLPSEVVRFLSSHHGVVEPDPIIYTLRGPADEASTLRRFEQALPSMFRRSAWNRLGIGVFRPQQETVSVLWQQYLELLGIGVFRLRQEMVSVLAMWQQYLELRPLPRELASGARTRIAGRLLRPYRDPQVVITLPSGDVRRLPMALHGEAFDTELRCAFGDGRYQAEMLASDAGGPLVLANFPVYCGVRAPPDVQAYEEAEGEEIDPAEAEQELLALINRDRRGAGLEPLIWDNRLAAIARSHSREMAARRYVAHVSPTTGDAEARVRAAGLGFSLVSENVAQEGAIKQAHHGFMGSPGHRANILHPRLTHLGVGIVAATSRGSGTPLYITELFGGQR